MPQRSAATRATGRSRVAAQEALNEALCLGPSPSLAGRGGIPSQLQALKCIGHCPVRDLQLFVPPRCRGSRWHRIRKGSRSSSPSCKLVLQAGVSSGPLDRRATLSGQQLACDSKSIATSVGWAKLVSAHSIAFALGYHAVLCSVRLVG